MDTAATRNPAGECPNPEKTVLLIAYHFPPLRGSSGLQRTLRFARYLPRFGWRPIVLTIDPRAYPLRGGAPGNEVPDDLEVHRAFGLDAKRHLSLFGRHPKRVAIPDRWATWRFAAVRTAVRLCRARNVEVIWSTFPIPSAHRIGMEVSRRTGLPWVAEFRDPMWQGENYPSDPEVNAAWKSLERDTLGHAAVVVVTTPGASRVYRQRYDGPGMARIAVIENGYDEEVFARAEQSPVSARAATGDARGPSAGPIILLHSGTVYPSERDPTALFEALSGLKRDGAITSSDLRVVLRASGYLDTFSKQIRILDIEDLVFLEPGLPYLKALREMLTVDGLLLLQASNCNEQIPAKLYEYVRAGRPILALTDPAGDTAASLRKFEGTMIAPLDSRDEIRDAVTRFVSVVRAGSLARPMDDRVFECSRESRAGQLAQLLDEVTQERSRTRHLAHHHV